MDGKVAAFKIEGEKAGLDVGTWSTEPWGPAYNNVAVITLLTQPDDCNERASTMTSATAGKRWDLHHTRACDKGAQMWIVTEVENMVLLTVPLTRGRFIFQKH